MKEKLLTKNKSQRMLTGVMVALFFVLSVCTIFTGKYVPTEKGLTLWEPERTQKQDDGTRHIYFTADTDREDRSSLVFFTSHQWVEVFADGKQIYKLDYTGGIWGHTTGNVWNFVKLPEDATQIEVCLTACYPKIVGSSNKFYVGTGNEIYAALLRQSMPVFIISMLTLMVGLFIVLYWVIIQKSSQIDGTLLYLGVFSILLGLWSANETDVTALVITNRQASAFAAFAFLMVMPMAFIMFVKSFLEIKDEWYWKRICDINFGVIVVSFILNFTGIYEFRRSLWMTHMIIVLMLIYVFAVIITKIVKHQVDHRFKSCVGALALISVATIVDMGRFYKTSNNAGIFGNVSFLIFIVALGIESAKQAIESMKKRHRVAELEQFALNDSMTGLYNRNAYDYFANNAKKLENHMIVTFDLNNLKSCNDTYGHSTGDLYIVNSAHIIENIFERFGKCYRIGGDEFCCIIPKAKDFNVERFIQKLYQDVEVFNNKNIIPTEAAIACGYAFFTAEDTDIEKVRERADEMMYQNKKKLKGRD